MKRSIILVLLLLVVSCSKTQKLDRTDTSSLIETNGPDLEETTDFLAYIIGSNPPFSNVETSFEMFNFNDDKDEVEGGGFFYTIKMVDGEGNMMKILQLKLRQL